MKKYRLIFLCMFLACILYAENASAIIQDVKILLDEGTWAPKHSLDVLESQNRDTMGNFVKDIESFTYDIVEFLRLAGTMDFDSDAPPHIIFWYEQTPLEPIKIDKDRFYLGEFYQNYITILDAIYVEDMMKFTVKFDNDPLTTMLDWSKLIENNEIFDMFFIFDGDYLHVYIDEVLPENLFYTFARMNDATVNEFKTLMASNSCDLSNVTWPRYADGSSDYDDRIILTHKAGKIYLTTDNLRVRQEQGVTGNPLFTLPKDAPVKVLTLGTEETIDSITASWLQVEVAEDIIDTQGSVIEKGAVGWCFGGYVTTSSSQELGKIYNTTDNVSFWAENNTSGDPLFTLPKDVPVKVITRGNEETIDSSTANWLQVEIPINTRDIEGKKVAQETVGWCFGGYLTPTPKEIIEKSLFPTLLLIGGGVLLLGVVGVVVARKKRRTSK